MQKATRQQLKQQNRDLVLKILFGTSLVSRAEIARITRLTRTTVSSIVADLLLEGLVKEVGTGVSIGGKSPILLSLVDDSRFLVGLDLGYDRVLGGVVGLRGKIHRLVSQPNMEPYDEKILPTVLAVVDHLLNSPFHPVVGISVGAPRGIHTLNGKAVPEGNLFGFVGSIEKLLWERYHLPVLALHDFQAAAIGEYLQNESPSDRQNVLVVRVDKEIGAGIIMAGQIFQGDDGVAGDLGHMVMMQNGGLACRCGKFGCLETISSSRAVVTRVGLLAGIRVETGMALTGAEITLDKIFEAYEAGDPLVGQILNQAGYHLGLALSGLVTALNIKQVILMGEMTRFGQPWLDVVKKTIQENVSKQPRQEIWVRIAKSRDHDVILGAAAMMSQNYSLLFKNS